MKIKSLSVDAIHDAHAYYKYLVGKKILYAIPYANQPAKCLDIQGKMVTNQGVPLCPGGLPMRRTTRNRYGENIYACPVKCPTNRKEVPHI